MQKKTIEHFVSAFEKMITFHIGSCDRNSFLLCEMQFVGFRRAGFRRAGFRRAGFRRRGFLPKDILIVVEVVVVVVEVVVVVVEAVVVVVVGSR